MARRKARRQGKQLATVTENSHEALEGSTGRCVFTLEGHQGASVNSVAWSSTSAWLASASSDHTIKIWEAAYGRCASYCSEGYFIGLGSAGPGRLRSQRRRLWRQAGETSEGPGSFRGRCMASLRAIRAHVNSVASVTKFDTAGLSIRAITLSRSGEATMGRCVSTLRGHQSVVNSVAWSADSAWLASASGDHTVKIWEAATGRYCLRSRAIRIGSAPSLWWPDSNLWPPHQAIIPSRSGSFQWAAARFNTRGP